MKFSSPTARDILCVFLCMCDMCNDAYKIFSCQIVVRQVVNFYLMHTKNLIRCVRQLRAMSTVKPIMFCSDVCMQWLEADFLENYVEKWVKDISSDQQHSPSERRKMTLSVETLNGLRITGTIKKIVRF